MYIDTVVVSGLIIVALVFVMAAVIGVFAYKHFQEDLANAEKNTVQKITGIKKAPVGAFL